MARSIWWTVSLGLSVPIVVLGSAVIVFLLVDRSRAGAGANNTEDPTGEAGTTRARLGGDPVCDPGALRPFTTEWGALDAAIFASIVDADLALVRYDGCSLELLEACRFFSVSGVLGAYAAPTSGPGAIEEIELDDWSRVAAALPLAQARLDGEVEAGARVLAFVSGSVAGTRETLYRDELARLPRCEGATHFVRSYELGAFALESGSVAIGVGDPEACSAETGAPSPDCRHPIRLELAPILDGANPDAAALLARFDEAELEAIGVLEDRREASAQAKDLHREAEDAMDDGDGARCLVALDARAEVLAANHVEDPEPEVEVEWLCVRCQMRAGQCQAGKAAARVHYEGRFPGEAERVDELIDRAIANHCVDGDMTPRDHVVQAHYRLGFNSRTLVEDKDICAREAEHLAKYIDQVELDGDRSPFLRESDVYLHAHLTGCYAYARKCEEAWTTFRERWPASEERPATEADERLRFARMAIPCANYPDNH